MEATEVVEVPDFVPQLNAHDRCDNCGAQARVTAIKGELRLLLCNHHARKHADGLVLAGWATLGGEEW